MPVLKVHDGTSFVQVPSGTLDAANISYAPAVLTDWDGDVDPGDLDDALDQLADKKATVTGTNSNNAIMRADGTDGDIQDSPVILDDSGVATFTAQSIHSSGVAVTTGGVAFPATQDAVADVNTLDDYEEGTFTPGIADTSLDGSGEGQAYAFQVGSYTKIGRMVFFHCKIRITNLGTLTTTEPARVVGLPFTSKTLTNDASAVCVGVGSSFALNNASESVTGEISSNVTHIALNLWDSTAGTTAFLISELSVGAIISVAGHYEV